MLDKTSAGFGRRHFYLWTFVDFRRLQISGRNTRRANKIWNIWRLMAISDNRNEYRAEATFTAIYIYVDVWLKQSPQLRSGIPVVTKRFSFQRFGNATNRFNCSISNKAECGLGDLFSKDCCKSHQCLSGLIQIGGCTYWLDFVTSRVQVIFRKAFSGINVGSKIHPVQRAEIYICLADSRRNAQNGNRISTGKTI